MGLRAVREGESHVGVDGTRARPDIPGIPRIMSNRHAIIVPFNIMPLGAPRALC